MGQARCCQHVAFILLPSGSYMDLKRQFPLLPLRALNSRIYFERRRQLGKSSSDGAGCFVICLTGPLRSITFAQVLENTQRLCLWGKKSPYDQFQFLQSQQDLTTMESEVIKVQNTGRVEAGARGRLRGVG